MALKHGALLLWLVAGTGSYAQTPGPDAASVLVAPDDTVKVMRLSDLCYAYRRIDGDSALLYGNMAADLARRLRFAKGEAQAFNDMAIIHMDRSAYDQADSLLRRALRIRETMNDHAGMGAIHNKLGNIFQARFRLEEALDENFQALAIYERIGPPAHEALILNNIGILQFNLRRYDSALRTHERAAALRERIGDATGLAASQGNLANVRVQMGDTSEAIVLYAQAIDRFRAKGLRQELAVQLNNLAGILLARNELTKAERMYREALQIRQEAGDQKAIASSMIGLGGVHLRQGKWAEARTELMDALRSGRELGVRSEQMQALLDLSRLHARQDHGDSTFWYHQQYVALRDSVFNDDLQQRIADLETRYETERKERQIVEQRAVLAEKDRSIAELRERAERRRSWLIAAVATIALLLLGALLVLQVQRRKARAARDAALIQEREAGLRAVLTATDTERKRIASELHDGVGQQLTGLKFRLEHIAGKAADQWPAEARQVKEIAALAEEAGRDVRHIAHSMMPRALGELGLAPALHDMLQKLFATPGTTHTFEHFGLEQRPSAAIEVGLYRIAQELVGNVIKHARATEVHVQLLRNRNHLVLIVEDNGQGLPTGRSGPGMGLRNIQDRTRALHGTAEFDSTPGQGTVATIRIPFPEEVRTT